MFRSLASGLSMGSIVQASIQFSHGKGLGISISTGNIRSWRLSVFKFLLLLRMQWQRTALREEPCLQQFLICKLEEVLAALRVMWL